MPAPTVDPLHQCIYNYINPRRGQVPEHVMTTVAGNIAFLIRYTYSPDIDPKRVTVLVIDVRGHNNCEIGHKAVVTVHGKKGKFTVIVEEQVPWGQNVIVGLTEKVDRVIRNILEKEGNKGFGDFNL